MFTIQTWETRNKIVSNFLPFPGSQSTPKSSSESSSEPSSEPSSESSSKLASDSLSNQTHVKRQKINQYIFKEEPKIRQTILSATMCLLFRTSISHICIKCFKAKPEYCYDKNVLYYTINLFVQIKSRYIEFKTLGVITGNDQRSITI